MTPIPFSNPITRASSSSTSCTNTKNTFALTLHLVRHAETVANCQGIVLGQSDSPLTCKGIQQAQAAGVGVACSYWKVFSSDLGRCVHTARLMVDFNDAEEGEKKDDDDGDDENDCGDADNSHTANDKQQQQVEKRNHQKVIIIQDKRLRERAKGIREGRSKLLTHAQIQLLIKEEKETNEKKKQEDTHVLEETEEQVMQRFQNWLHETIQDAYQQHLWETMGRRRQQQGGCGTTAITTTTTTTTTTNHDTHHHGTKHSCQGSFHVLAVTHSGTLRIALEQLVGNQIPRNARREEDINVKEEEEEQQQQEEEEMQCGFDDDDGSGSTKDKNHNNGRLIIPNTSKTVIQFTKCTTGKKDVDSATASLGGRGGGRGGRDEILLGSSWWNATLLDYTNVFHLKNDE